MKLLSKVLIISLTFFMNVISQMTKGDLTYIKNVLKPLVNGNLDYENYLAADSLRIIGEKVESKPFKKNLSFEVDDNNELNYLFMQFRELIGVNTALNENLKYVNELESLVDIEKVFELANFHHKLKLKYDWEKLYNYLENFKSDIGMFSNKKDEKTSSLEATFYALRIFYILSKNKSEKSELSSKLENFSSSIKNLLKGPLSNIQYLSNNIGIFTELNSDNFRLNKLAVESFSDLIDLNFDNYEKLKETVFLIRNYFLKFKSGITSLEKIHSILKVLELTNLKPVIKFTKNSIFIDEDQNIPFLVLDSFGNETKNFQVDFKYSRLNSEKVSKSLSSSEDIDDIPDETSESNKKVYEKTFKGESSGLLNFSDISDFGDYKYSVDIKVVDLSSNKVIEFSENLSIRASPRIKVNYISVSVHDPENPTSKSENKIEFPKRSFKSFKGNQNSVLKVKLKVS